MGRAPWLLLVGVALLPTLASAENLEEFGFGPRAQAMGGAHTGLASGPLATYYNPAGLTLSRHVNLVFGYSYATPMLRFDSQAGGEVDHQTERVPGLPALTLGVSTTIPLDIPDRFGFGLGLFIPTRGVIDLETQATSTNPEFFSYGRRHDRLLILPALAVKVTDWLSLGLGASVVLDASGGTTIEGGLTTPVQTRFEIDLDPDAGVVLGLLLSPARRFSFGVTYRSELSMTVEFPATAILEGISLPLDLETVQYFSPHQVQVGAAVDVTDALLLTLDVAWVNWSAYETGFLEVRSGVATVVDAEELDLRDVVSPKLGAELVVTDWLALRAGYMYRTSAVPDQDRERTNLVDSPKHVLTVGAGLRFGEPPEAPDEQPAGKQHRARTLGEALADASLDVDVFLQWHLHERVSASKPAGDPLGSWDASGGILNLGFSVTARF